MKNVKAGHKQPIVCLDAGHSGKANQSPVVKEYYESEMTWKLHNYLGTELEACGIQVKKTRKDQAVGMDLVERGKASKGCDLFISIHSDACGSESVDRPTAIPLSDDNCGKIDEASAQVAALLAEVVEKTMQTKGQAQVRTRNSEKDRNGDGKKNDDWYGVLVGAHQVGTPGLILEHSFHTNTRSAKWLLVDENLQALAKAEAVALAGWFGMDEAEDDTPAKVPTEGQDAPQAVKKIYRVRKSKDDAASQLGAFLNLEYAKAACPPGFSVFDWTGKAVYTNPALAAVKVAAAQEFTKAKAGTYKVKATTGLNVRAGASTNYDVIERLKNGSLVKCYGYHTGDWLYIKTASGTVGFCSGSYLTKV